MLFNKLSVMKSMNRLAAVTLIVASSSVFALPSGQPAPDFTLPALGQSAQIKLAEFKGKVVYVDFWASWCGPCRKALPLLNDVYKTHKAKGLEIIGVNEDERQEDAFRFLDRHPVSFTLAHDKDGKVAELYHLQGMPSSFLLNKQGDVVKTYIGFKTSEINAIIKDIETALTE